MAAADKSLVERILEGDFHNKVPFGTRGTERDAWRAEESRLDELFKQEALKDVGLDGHPRADKIYAYAWSQGHASGYREVHGCLIDLAELFLD